MSMELKILEKSYASIIIKQFRRHKLAMIGVGIILTIIILAVFAPLVSPYEPNEISGAFSEGPSKEHILGTDQIGRDVFSRLIFASRVSLAVGIGSMFITLIIGITLGLISGYFGGIIDMVIMRITDVFMAFPSIMLILVASSIIGPGLINIIFILGFLEWPSVARLVRGNVLSIKKLDYVNSSIVMGFKTPRILFSHILPNVLAPVLIYATSGIAGAILDEAALSFLGLGVQPPVASWGNMLNSATSITILTTKLWLWIPPGVMIILSVLSINYIGDALRDALDPKNNI